jgi:putative nucleotidyltransferase with HDIG domain
MLLARFRTLETLILILPLPVILYVTVRHALGRAEDQISHLGNLNKVYVAAIEALAHAVDAKDQVTHDHTRRVHDETMRLARALKVEGDAEIQAINAAALLHDVGKLAIPEHILNKPGPLTPAEYEIMKRHATIGADILSVIGLPYDVAPIVRHHHENWNGTGYPDGLAGDRIPIGSRILAVVDCFDALTSDRPYRPRMTDRDALQIVTDRRGNMYDPQVVDAFLASHAQGAATASVPSPAPVQAASRSISAPQPQPPVRVGERRDDVDLQLFFNVGRALAEARSITDIGRVLWTHCRLALRASAFVLYAYDETSDAIVAVYTAGDLSGGIQGTRIPLGDRLSGWVAATGQAVMNSDGRLDFVTGGRDESRLRSALAAPIATDGRPLGVLTFYSEAANAFDDVQRRLVLALSAAIAASVLQLTPSSRAPGADVSQHGTGALQK